MKMTTEEAFVKVLQMHGIRDAFGIIGSAFMPISDLFPKAGITFWDVAHECNGGYMADGYTRASGKMAMCIAQNGPGITNFVTAVKTAYWNHTPMLLVTPQAANKTIGQGGFQEVEQMAAFKDMVCLPGRSSRSFPHHGSPEPLSSPMRTVSRHPAQINLPRDYWTQVIDAELPEIVQFERPAWRWQPGLGRCRQAAVGSQVPRNSVRCRRRARQRHCGLCAALAEKLDAPVCNNYQHNDSFPGSHAKLAVGPLGYNGSKAAHGTDIQGRCCAGPWYPPQPVLHLPGYGIDYWPKDAKLIQVDINPDRIGLTKKVAVGIVAVMPSRLLSSLLANLTSSGWQRRPRGTQGPDPPDQVGLAADTGIDGPRR